MPDMLKMVALKVQIFTPFLASASRRTQCETGAKRQSGHGCERPAEFAVRTAATAPAGAQPMSIGTKSSRRRRDGGYDAILAAASFRAPACPALASVFTALGSRQRPKREGTTRDTCPHGHGYAEYPRKSENALAIDSLPVLRWIRATTVTNGAGDLY